MPGPVPIPTALKRLRGNPGKRALNAFEPPTLAGEIYLPPDVAADQVALEEWNRLVPMLKDMGIVGAQDYLVLADVCRTFAMNMKARKQLSKSSLTVKGGAGGEVINPLVRIVNSTQAALLRMYATLGLDPSGRARLKVEKKSTVAPTFGAFKREA